MSPKSYCNSVTIIWVAIATCHLVFSPAFSVPTPKTKTEETEVNYGLLLDAGSTSTKLKIYKWRPTDTFGDAVPQIQLLLSTRTEPGLATFVKDETGLGAYLRDMLLTAKHVIPEEKHRTVPVFVMATAGFRYLSETNANKLMERVRQLLLQKDINPFFRESSRVTVLSGEEEGVYAWVTANYLLGFFDKNSPLNQSVGILEMGGGSTQIAFIPEGHIFSEEFQVVVAGKRYFLYVQSYLQYGSNGIALRVAETLAQKAPDMTELTDPCMLRGDTKQQTLQSNKTVALKGSGSPSQCSQLLKEMLKPNTGIDCQPKPCAIGSVHQPTIPDMTFYGTGGYLYAPSSLGAVRDDDVLQINKLEEAAVGYCDRTLEQAINESSADPRYASDDCLMALYIPILLNTSYGFPKDSKNVRSTRKIGGESLDWALGAMLVELSTTFGMHRRMYDVTCQTVVKGDHQEHPPVGYVIGNNSAAAASNSINLGFWVSLQVAVSKLYVNSGP